MATVLLSAGVTVPVGFSFIGMDGITGPAITAQLFCGAMALFGAPVAALCNTLQSRRLWQGPTLCVAGVAGAFLLRQLSL